eukprot:m.133600 g.133600  ORF g.133600 m.133600 type:complete len:307 (+) comp20103_c1_seq5:981-1901(+)
MEYCRGVPSGGPSSSSSSPLLTSWSADHKISVSPSSASSSESPKPKPSSPPESRLDDELRDTDCLRLPAREFKDMRRSVVTATSATVNLEMRKASRVSQSRSRLCLDWSSLFRKSRRPSRDTISGLSKCLRFLAKSSCGDCVSGECTFTDSEPTRTGPAPSGTLGRRSFESLLNMELILRSDPPESDIVRLFSKEGGSGQPDRWVLCPAFADRGTFENCGGGSRAPAQLLSFQSLLFSSKFTLPWLKIINCEVQTTLENDQLRLLGLGQPLCQWVNLLQQQVNHGRCRPAVVLHTDAAARAGPHSP